MESVSQASMEAAAGEAWRGGQVMRANAANESGAWHGKLERQTGTEGTEALQGMAALKRRLPGSWAG